MPVSRLFPRRFSGGQRTRGTDREERTLAVLVGAKALIERGWMQGGWYVTEAPDGSRRFVGAGSPTPRGSGTVVQACLVGAVVEAAMRHGPDPMLPGPALDALWRTLLSGEGRQVDRDRRVPSPAERGVEVRELTRWNDHRDRTREDVLRLLDSTIRGVLAAGAARASGEVLGGALATA
jgi:hypothetical protein